MLLHWMERSARRSLRRRTHPQKCQDGFPSEDGQSQPPPRCTQPCHCSAQSSARASLAAVPKVGLGASPLPHRSAPDIPLAEVFAALASHIFILTSHGLGPFPLLPSVSLLYKNRFWKTMPSVDGKGSDAVKRTFMSFASILVVQHPCRISLFMILSSYVLCLIARRCC